MNGTQEKSHGARGSNGAVGLTDRAQSVLDFAVGVSLFLIVVVGVFAFIPTAFGAVSDDGGADGEDAVAAERVADYLVETALASSDASVELDRFCTLAYFEDADRCGFESGNTLAADSALAETQPLNVTIEGETSDGDDERELLCWTGSGLDKVASCGTGTPLTAGSSAAANENFVAATRVARFDGRTVFVVVRTW
jgi:hypothetical protein